MTGTLRAARVPYDEDDPQYEEAVDTLNEYARSYPVSGELRVRRGIRRGRALVRVDTAFTASFFLNLETTAPNTVVVLCYGQKNVCF